MPRISGVRERRHQPFWDTLIRTEGAPRPKLQPSTRLFGNANVGNLAATNLQVAGQLASDQTYVALSLRNWMFFDGPNKRQNYEGCMSQLHYTLTVGDKPQFVAPAWYFPSGGGIYGGGGGDNASYNAGYPSQSAIMKLARPIGCTSTAELQRQRRVLRGWLEQRARPSQRRRAKRMSKSSPS